MRIADSQNCGIAALEEVEDYCRQVETYLCRKNDGHLIRIVGPSFERVSGWAAQGIPLKLVFGGVDRYFERYYSKGARRRPVRIDFCEADVLDLFDEWRRVVGLTQSGVESRESTVESRLSLPSHLGRVVTRLTQARANGSIGADFDAVLDAVGRELEVARAGGRGLRGAARQALIDRLAALDAELLQMARGSIDEATHAALLREAEEELATFRASMSSDAFGKARRAAVDRLIRERLALPTMSFTQG